MSKGEERFVAVVLRVRQFRMPRPALTDRDGLVLAGFVRAKHTIRAAIAVIFMGGVALRAAEGLESATSWHETRLAEIDGAAFKAKVKVDAGYKAALEELEAPLKSSGELDALLALRAELERFGLRASLTEADVKTSEAALASVQREFLTRYTAIEQRETAAAAAQLLAYAQKLRALKKTLTVDGEIEAAVKAGEALEAAKGHLLEAVASLSPEIVVPGVEHRSVDIPVKEKWGVAFAVKSGETIGFSVTGKWKVRRGGRNRGPGDSAFYFAGRLDGGDLFKIGAKKTLDIEHDGKLELGMHEGGTYSNNSGKVTAEIIRFRL